MWFLILVIGQVVQNVESWGGREAHKIEGRLLEASKQFGLVEHQVSNKRDLSPSPIRRWRPCVYHHAQTRSLIDRNALSAIPFMLGQ